MSAFDTKLTIFNRALNELEQDPIVDVDEVSSNAAALRLHYDAALEITLSSHHWDFAVKYLQLSLISSADNLTAFQYLYAAPEDCLKIEYIYDGDKNKLDYEKTSEGIYTTTTPVYIKYVSRVTDFSKMSSAFCDALALNLAERCAARILGSSNKGEFLEGKAGRMQGIAASQSNQKGKRFYTVNSSWIIRR